MQIPATSHNTIAFQGALGAYSHLACKVKYPDMAVLPCASFEEAIGAVQSGEARLAMIPIENSTAGRVADIHILLPGSGLFIIAEHFETIDHCLLAVKSATLKTLKTATSHVQALSQCRKTLQKIALKPVPFADTAGAAKHIADLNDPTVAAIASSLAAKVYNLDIKQKSLQDKGNNTTRFVVLSREANNPKTLKSPTMTTFTFEVKNVPAALYKAMGGFATNGVNMTKLESYYDSDSFTATEFFADIEGSLNDENVARAMEELQFHSKRITLLGSYMQERSRTLGL